jgi:hypothetical protein
MTYTTQQLQAMEDADINEAIHKALDRWINEDGQITYMLGNSVIYQNEGGLTVSTNYCNNLNDIMPLAFELLIAIEPEAQAFTDKVSGNWIATDFNIKHQYIDKSPLRAIACLILMMEE